MTSAYFTQSDLENRLSANVVARALDDNNDGSADAGPVARLIADASSYVDGFLRGVYTLPLSPSVPNEVKRLALDVAAAMLAIRHPAYVKFDGFEAMKLARADLKDLREGRSRLDIMTAPEPAANEGATIVDGTGNTDTTPHAQFFGNTGFF